MTTKKSTEKKYVHPYDKLTNAGYVFMTNGHRGPTALYHIKKQAQNIVDSLKSKGYPAEVVKCIRGTPIEKGELYPHMYMIAWKPK